MAGESLQQRRKLGKTYAQALYDLAVERGLLDEVRSSLGVWKDLLRQEPALVRFFESILVTTQEREKFLEQFRGEFHPLILNFLGVLNRRDRLGVLPQVIEAFEEEDDRRRGRIRVRLTTAVAIESHVMEDIRRRLGTYLGQDPVIDHRINPALLGGFVAQAEDRLIDGSVKTRLGMWEKYLLKRGEDEIQSRRDFISDQA